MKVSKRLHPFAVPPGAYAKLSPDQLANAARYGIQRSYTADTRLYRQGERAADLYIVLEGIVQTFWSEHQRRRAIHYSGREACRPRAYDQKESMLAAVLQIATVAPNWSVAETPRDRRDASEEPFLVSPDDESTVAARSVVIATGARYRKLNAWHIGGRA